MTNPLGVITTDFYGYQDKLNAMQVLNDGSILVAGEAYKSYAISDFGLAKYNNNGSLNTAFGISGKVSTDFNVKDQINALQVLSDGSIIVAGSSENENTFFSTDFALAKYNSNGSLNTAFGNNGKVTTDFNGYLDKVNALQVLNNGSILAAGATYNSSGIPSFALAKYHSDGSLDTTFSSDGKAHTIFSFSYSSISAMQVLSNRSILVAGYTYNSNHDYDFALAKYHSNGVLDTTFGTKGRVTFDFNHGYDRASAMQVLNDGSILVAGQHNNDFALLKYNSYGVLDSSFGDNGKVITDFNGGNEGINTLKIFSDGSILAAGYSYDLYMNVLNIELAKYQSNGTLDATFGNNGKTIVPTPYNYLRQLAAMHISNDGSILVAGNNMITTGKQGDFILANYNADGSLNTAFDGVSAVVINGNTIKWQTLTVSHTLTDVGDSSAIYYQWSVNNTPIKGATHSTYTLTGSDVGKTITVAVSYTDVLGNANSISSLPTKAIAAGFNLVGTANDDVLNGAATNDILAGNAGNDVLNGNAGNDFLTGRDQHDSINGGNGDDKIYGGAGNDVLIGGAGKDTFIFDTPLKTIGIDNITDFNPVDDTIKLESSVFMKLPSIGVLPTANFVQGINPLDRDDYIIYNPSTGAVFYDADGNGKGIAVQIAILGADLALTNADFMVA